MLDYLKGAQKGFVHYRLKVSEGAVSFAGGKAMDDVSDKARRACGNVVAGPRGDVGPRESGSDRPSESHGPR